MVMFNKAVNWLYGLGCVLSVTFVVSTFVDMAGHPAASLAIALTGAGAAVSMIVAGAFV